jgi:flagellar hook assembly protein FlgD
VYNYPNPFSRSTYFTFEQNQRSNLDVEIKIYTVAGRLVQTLKRSNIVEQFVRIPWDGRDRDGDAIANGVYLYKIIAKTTDGRLSAETLGKLSILK